jgi:hypothetical protein
MNEDKILPQLSLLAIILSFLGGGNGILKTKIKTKYVYLKPKTPAEKVRQQKE